MLNGYHSNKINPDEKAMDEIRMYLGSKVFLSLSQQVALISDKKTGFFILSQLGIPSTHATAFLKQYSLISDWDHFSQCRKPKKADNNYDSKNQGEKCIHLKCSEHCSNFKKCNKTCLGVKWILGVQ